MEIETAVTKIATLLAEIVACSHDTLGESRAQRINARCFEIVRAMHFHSDPPERQEGMTTETVPTVDDRCGDRCPTDSTERCRKPPGHGGWHEGLRLRWRRQ